MREMVEEITSQIKSLHEEQALDGWARAQLDATLVRLVNATGRTERIKSTVMVFIYLSRRGCAAYPAWRHA